MFIEFDVDKVFLIKRKAFYKNEDQYFDRLTESTNVIAPIIIHTKNHNFGKEKASNNSSRDRIGIN